MAIDWSKVGRPGSDLRHEKVTSLVFDDLGGVEVAWVRYTGPEFETYGILTDESQYEEEIDGTMVRVSRNDTEVYHHCKEAVRRAQDRWMADARERNAERWAGLEPKEAVLDVARRVWEGEWFGQYGHKMIYAQEVARLLGYPNPDAFGSAGPIWEVLRTLRDEERLDINGAILVPYRAHFRFPEEIRGMIRLMVEEPLGWPNGEAGDGALAAIEEAIGANTSFKHGKDLVWEENFPRLSPRHLLGFGLGWVDRALKKAAVEGWDATLPYEREKVIERLRKLLEIAERSR